jgi:predicted glycosyltransferase
LHPARFTPDSRVLEEIGIKPGEIFFVLRFVSWNAGHDMGQKGLSLSGKRRLVHLLERHGRVLITSEGDLPDELARYRASISPGMIHHLLGFAHMYVGEGGTMATESAILGTPAVLINPLRAGNFDELRDKYQLLQQFDNIDQAYPTIETLVNTRDLKERWSGRREILLRDKMDASAFIIETVLPSSKTAEGEDSSGSPRLTASLD